MKKILIVLIVIFSVLILVVAGIFYAATWSPNLTIDDLTEPHWGIMTFYCNADDAVVNLTDKNGTVLYTSVIKKGRTEISLKWSGIEDTSDVAYLSVTKDGYAPLKLNINQHGFKPYAYEHSSIYIITLVPLSGDISQIQSDNATAGIIQVFCNIDGAAAGVKYDGLIFLSNVVTSSALISMSIDNTGYMGRGDYFTEKLSSDKNLLFVSADGYKPETISNVTYPKIGETVTYSVTLTPLLSDESVQRG
ncbi:MAG TPA: hypothetical protein O0X39_04480 [Methanocorpusculum sp.]|nr:hypothetical protein [Methanocorpusculum sp.]